MNEKDEKLIQERKQKVLVTFGDRNNLFIYLFETLDNFYYRYLETSLTKNLHTTEFMPNAFGAVSFETILEALKKPHPEAKAGIIALAKEDRNANIRFGLWVEVKELTQDFGSLKIVAEINWGSPEFQDPSKRLQKIVNFKYDDFQVFRKQLALKLGEASELFL
jgi:hypothetical protein